MTDGRRRLQYPLRFKKKRGDKNGDASFCNKSMIPTLTQQILLMVNVYNKFTQYMNNRILVQGGEHTLILKTLKHPDQKD